ncbi:hypothetical protein A0H76_2329 [Hepatospora eriocheir]|uniref:Ubiquitin-related modifier 1 n=1 Tax=Hepatospora eriocheir TaxID=1081669 RepID=A0A1X0QJV9_9MICR|nr:hypothetical protein A0H76_2329 [Hepatospora eriocheir]
MKIEVNFRGSGDHDDDKNLCFLEKSAVENIKTKNGLIELIYNNFNKTHSDFFKDLFNFSDGTLCLIDDVEINLFNEEEIKNIQKIDIITTLHGG